MTQILKGRKTDPKQMVHTAKHSLLRLALNRCPATFWDRSLFTKPADREVVCHASAWDIDYEKDVRLKMCIQINEEDFHDSPPRTGPQLLPDGLCRPAIPLSRSANDGFHEAIGDTMALSVTPAYLKQIGLIDKVPDQSADIGFLLQRALDKVAFLPFGYLVDQWRWKVFSGEVDQAITTGAGGICARSTRDFRRPRRAREQDFDAGAKYHVPANTPYARYFLARFSSSSFIARYAAKPDSRVRFISVRFTETSRPAKS